MFGGDRLCPKGFPGELRHHVSRNPRRSRAGLDLLGVAVGGDNGLQRCDVVVVDQWFLAGGLDGLGELDPDIARQRPCRRDEFGGVLQARIDQPVQLRSGAIGIGVEQLGDQG